MKRFFYLIVSLSVIICSSCEDTSNEYVEQLFTNAELTNAVRACLNASKDTAINHLCAANEFLTNGSYQFAITSIPELQKMKDTLAVYGESDMVDSLIAKINATYINMGNYLASQSGTLITTLTCPDPHALVYGEQHAITNYFRIHYQASFESSLAQALSIQLNASGASSYWNNILSRYYEHTHTPVSADLQRHVMTVMLNAFYTEMANEEALIRTDESHRTSAILKNVFGNNN